MNKKLLMIASLIVMWCAGVTAQTVTIRGKVTDRNNSGLPGATVVVKGTTTGTTTDSDGYYQLPVTNNQNNESSLPSRDTLSMLGAVFR